MRAAPWLVVLTAAVGCADDDAPWRGRDVASGGPSTETRAPVASEPAPSVIEERKAGAAQHPPRPGPYRARGAAAVAANAACEGCHPSEAKEWRASRHRHAETNPAYRRAFAVEPSAFCRGCHAPEAPLALDADDPTRPPEKEIADLGVGCVSCHVIDEGTVLASSRPAGDGAGDGARDGARDGPHDGVPHAVLATNDFGHTGACASCHEFSFPGRGGREDAAFMQTTVREHAASTAADRPCASCHMPSIGGRRSHAFAATRDPAWLRESLHASATIGPVGAAVVTLRPLSTGHAFPTGDLFRRLEVGAERVGRNGRVIQREVRYLARHFEIRAGEPGRTLVRDDRLRDGPVEIDLDVSCPPSDAPDAPGERARWWVTYQRVAETHRGDVPADADIESEVRLHEGSLCNSSERR